MTDTAPAEAENVAEAEVQLVPAGNTDSYVTTLSKEEEEKLLKASLELHDPSETLASSCLHSPRQLWAASSSAFILDSTEFWYAGVLWRSQGAGQA